jgi:hypothetical protein
MAKVTFTMPDDFMDKVSRLGERTDEIIPRVLDAGGQVVLAQVRRNLESVISKGTQSPSRSTGQLVSALGVSPARMDRQGNFNVKVGFAEPRQGGTSNALVANVLEYGKHGQPPRPFLKQARAQSRSACIDAMKRKLEDEVRGV